VISSSRLPADRHLDNRWNRALDALTKTWNELGPDVTLAALKLLSEPEVTDEGLVLVEIAAAGGGAA
jgi:hypothetical protein